MTLQKRVKKRYHKIPFQQKLQGKQWQELHAKNKVYRIIIVDIKNPLKSKNTSELIKLFAQLIKEAMEKFEKKFPDLSKESKKRLWNFHNELLKYAEELE